MKRPGWLRSARAATAINFSSRTRDPFPAKRTGSDTEPPAAHVERRGPVLCCVRLFQVPRGEVDGEAPLLVPGSAQLRQSAKALPWTQQ